MGRQSIEPVKRTRAYEEIVRQLTDLIRQGEMKPGDRLPPERELAKAFAVGRPTLRQALTVLAELGVLEILPGSGVFLRKPITDALGTAGHAMAMLLVTEQQNLHHILELRIAIEGNAAYLAAQRRTEQHIADLQAAFDALGNAFSEKGVAIREDFQFHSKIAEATGNPVFVKVMVSLADLFLQQFQQTTRHLYHEPDRLAANLREHSAILEAIIDRRAEDAREAMVRHLKRVAERMERAQQLPPS